MVAGVGKIRKQAIGENMLYAMVWSLVYLIPIMNAKLMSEEHVNFSLVLISWIKISPYFILFLINNTLLCGKLVLKHRYYTYAIISVLMLGITFGAISIYEQWIIEQNSIQASMVESRHASLTDLEWSWNIILGAFMFLANVGIKMLYKSMVDDEDMQRLQFENSQAKMENLKYQINPHFFMNTLNNIHALVDLDPEAAKRCIIELSGMMRYVVYDTGTNSIQLQRDIEFMRNYIELMRIRYNDDIDIEFRYPDVIPLTTLIPPLVIIVFIENAFKHGVSYDRKSFIHINISIEHNTVIASISNSMASDGSRKRRKTGIGIDNTRRRLDLIYGTDYTLRIDDSAKDVFNVELKLPILAHD